MLIKEHPIWISAKIRQRHLVLRTFLIINPFGDSLKFNLIAKLLWSNYNVISETANEVNAGATIIDTNRRCSRRSNWRRDTKQASREKTARANIKRAMISWTRSNPKQIRTPYRLLYPWLVKKWRRVSSRESWCQWTRARSKSRLKMTWVSEKVSEWRCKWKAMSEAELLEGVNWQTAVIKSVNQESSFPNTFAVTKEKKTNQNKGNRVRHNAKKSSDESPLIVLSLLESSTNPYKGWMANRKKKKNRSIAEILKLNCRNVRRTWPGNQTKERLSEVHGS